MLNDLWPFVTYSDDLWPRREPRLMLKSWVVKLCRRNDWWSFHIHKTAALVAELEFQTSAQCTEVASISGLPCLLNTHAFIRWEHQNANTVHAEMAPKWQKAKVICHWQSWHFPLIYVNPLRWTSSPHQPINKHITAADNCIKCQKVCRLPLACQWRDSEKNAFSKIQKYRSAS